MLPWRVRTREFVGGLGLDSEYVAVLDYATSQGWALPSIPVQIAQSYLLVLLRSLGIWALLDVFYCFYGDGDANFALINWKDPGQFQGVPQAGVTYASFTGFDTNNSGGVATGFNFSTNGVQYQNTNACLFIDNGNFVSGVLKQLINSGDGTYFVRMGLRPGSTSNFTINQLTTSTPGHNSLTTAVGLHYMGGNTAIQNYFEGRFLTLSTSPNLVQRPNAECVLGTAAADWGLKMAGLGANLTGKQAGLYYAWTLYLAKVGGVLDESFEIEYQRIIATAYRLGFTLPSAAAQAKENQLIIDLKSNGIWNNLDVFYNFYTDGSAGYACINWKAPELYLITRVNSPTFTSLSGFNSDGTTSYMNLAVSLNTLTQFALNNASATFEVAGNSNQLPVWGAGNNASMLNGSDFAFGGTGLGGRLNCTTAGLNGAVTGGDGVITHQRKISTDTEVYKNGTSIGTIAQTSTGKSTQSIYLLCRNLGGTANGFNPSTAVMRFFALGNSLTGLEQTFNDVWTDFKNS